MKGEAPMNRMVVDDYEKWGNLVKNWAKNPGTAPRSVDALREACEAAGVTISLPEEVTEVEPVEYKPNKLVLKLPPATLVMRAEEELSADSAEYTYLPDFYAETFRRELERSLARGEGPKLRTIPTLSTKEERLKFQAERIGDYTISMCQ